MLCIRQEQMDALRNEILRRFGDRMEVYLRSQFPEKTRRMEKPQLREVVHKGIVRAREYEVMYEPDVCRYLECMIVHGVEFDRDAATSWAGDILRRKDLDGRAKMNRIDDYEMFSLEG